MTLHKLKRYIQAINRNKFPHPPPPQYMWHSPIKQYKTNLSQKNKRPEPQTNKNTNTSIQQSMYSSEWIGLLVRVWPFLIV